MTSLKTLVALLSENILRKGIQNLQLPNPSDGDDVEKKILIIKKFGERR